MPRRKRTTRDNVTDGLVLVLLGVIYTLQQILPLWLRWVSDTVFLVGLGYIIAVQYDREKTNELIGIVGEFVVNIFNLVFNLLSTIIKKYVLKKGS